ncbi:conserved exported hypothetical protein [Hyphomicrobiales bacterium]|nr:conserved exported hypothetical protein [Hyphomicrobiales bacterium]
MKRTAFIRAGAVLIGAGLCLSAVPRPASACNRTAGCAMDVLLEGHDMMVDGQMADNMRAAQENIQAFKRQQQADQAAGRTRPTPR